MAGHQVSDGGEVIEYAYEQGWSDGLPVVPPTPDRIGRMLDAFSYPSDEEIGRVVERQRVITAGHVAANAVMAGCTDDLFPVVLAAVEAILDPRFNVVGPTASTGGSAPLVIVHGPLVKELRFNSGSSALGSGNRSNLTLGRALNLVVRNACGSVPGHLDQSTLGHPGKVSYCLAEGPTGSWSTLGEGLGVPSDTSAVTVFAAEAPHYVADHANDEPEGLMQAFAKVARATNCTGSEIVVVLCPEHRAVFQRTGWTRDDFCEALYSTSKIPGEELKHTGRHSGSGKVASLSLVPEPTDILLVCAGGEGGGFSAIIPPWLGAQRGIGSKAVTKGVGVCLDC